MESHAAAPLFGLLFTAPLSALFAGSAAIALPIVIHLLNRRRYRIVSWAAMRFLLAAQKQNTRRMRLEQLILLLLRTLIVLLLVLAMLSAMPWFARALKRVFPGSAVQAARAGLRTHKVLVVDGSFSMACKVGESTAFDKARKVAAEILEASPRGDGFSVVVLGAPPQRLVPGPSDDSQRVRQAIQDQRQPHGSAQLAETLQEVERILAESPVEKYAAREVYFLTDLQRSLWLPPQPLRADLLRRIQERARIIFVDVGSDNVPNLAISDVRLGASQALTGVETPILATLHQFGGQEPRRVRVELLVGKARVSQSDPPLELRAAAQEVVTIAPGRRGESIRFGHRFSTPGDYVLQVRAEHDILALDDVRSVVVSVKDSIPVMLVNGSTEGDSATDLLQTALNPYPPGLAPKAVAARPKTLSVRDFNYATAADLANYECIFLGDVERLTRTESLRLETYLRSGGGLVVSLGSRANLEEYNRVLYRNGRGILPARLMGRRESGKDRFFTFLADEEAFRRPPLDTFVSDSDRLSLRSARFRQYVHSEPAARGLPQTLLAFLADVAPMDRAGNTERTGPAIIEWQPPLPDKGKGTDAEQDRAGLFDPPSLARPAVPQASLSRYRGRVVLITTSLNRDWADWPVSPSYLPFMQELLRFAASGRLREQAVEVGQPVEEFVLGGVAGQDLVIRTPDGREEQSTSQAHDEGSLIRWLETDQSGLYRVSIGRHPQEHVFAVNVPMAPSAQDASESDLARTNQDELQATYRDWELQLVTTVADVHHRGGPAPDLVLESSEELAARGAGIGALVARGLLLALVVLLLLEVVLAWQFGHFSAVGGTETPPAGGRLPPLAVGTVALVLFLVAALVLAHAAGTGDFLGFLPEDSRRAIEAGFGVPPPVAGEGTRWHLEYTPYVAASHATNLWLIGALAVGSLGLVIGVYCVEGHTAGTAYRLLLAGLRSFSLLLVLVVLLPQLRLLFERQGWPDLAIILDDSRSMGVTDPHRDPRILEAIQHLLPGNPKRLELAQALLARDEPDWLQRLLVDRKFKLHIYRVSPGAEETGSEAEAARWPLHLSRPGQRDAAVKAIQRLEARGESSPLGSTVRRVINDFRGASLAAVILFTDGVTTEGEDLLSVSRYAEQMTVPLFYVGLGAAHELRDVQVHDVQVEDAVYVNDRVIFEGRLTGQGYSDLVVPVRLKEKDKDGRERVLKTQSVRVDPAGKPVKFRIVHQPTEPGEKVYILEAQEQEDEIKPAANNRQERLVHVRDAKLLKVLYVEGYARYEYRFIKHLLERESAKDKRNKTIDLRVLLLEADDEYASEDRSALADFPTRDELLSYDVVVLGDVEPRAGKLGEKNLAHLADFVRERGGGLLFIAGERHSPHAFRGTPLQDILPIDLVEAGPPVAERVTSFRPELTAIGRFHPIFRFSPDESDNAAVWNKLAELYWWSEGVRPKPAAEVLLVHPRQAAGGVRRPGDTSDERQALAVQQFVGAGRSIFFGIEETWRWRHREDELRFNQFWIQMIRYLARSRSGSIRLTLDRQTPYRRGEPIRVTVRFPDDAPAPGPDIKVEVIKERTPPGQVDAAEKDLEVLRLAKVDGSRATYEHLLTRTPEGEYRFTLATPDTPQGKPRAEARVLPPPGEMEQLRMNQADLEHSAQATHGRFFTIADADELLDELPHGTRVSLHTPTPPWLLWNQDAVFLWAIGLLAAEWVLRKRKHLI